MKKFLALTIIVLTMNLVGFAQAKKVLSVKEYFAAIPEQYIKADAKKRAGWIDSDSAEDGYLDYTIPVAELGIEEGEGRAFGSVQLFEKSKGGVIVGLTTNMCAEGSCVGQVLFLDYNGGKWDDITSDLAPLIDNDEIGKILKDAPAYNKPIKKGEEIPLSISFNGTDKLIQFTAGETEKISDSGVVAKMFKWNGETFTEFQYEESPE
jgi:hypothetical protein